MKNTVLTVDGGFADTESVCAPYRDRRVWVSVDVAGYVDRALDGRLVLSGDDISFEHPVTHLLDPAVYVPFIDRAADSLITAVRALAR